MNQSFSDPPLTRSAADESFWIEALLSLVEPFAPPPFDKLATRVAAQIGLAKAMRKYDLRRLITFHSSVAKAERFVDATQPDSLPGVIPHLTRSTRPSGTLWAKHISGHTPAGQRATLLKGLGHLPDGTRGIISNCACLGEGVDE